MRLDDFSYGGVLGLLEVMGVMVCSGIERGYVGERGMRSPLRDYAGVVLCLMGSSALSNVALNYINYPTKVIFRSSKLIPTMIIAVVLNGRRVTVAEFLCGLAITLGLIVFTMADWEVSPNFNPLGAALVGASTVADSLLPNLQERLFDRGSSRVEVTFVTNVLVFFVMGGLLSLSGDVSGALEIALGSPRAAAMMLAYTFLAYLAINTHMQIVKEYGSIVAVLVGNARKALTILLSFIFFPKPFSFLYPLGGLLVLGGLTASAVIKHRSRDNLRLVR